MPCNLNHIVHFELFLIPTSLIKKIESHCKFVTFLYYETFKHICICLKFIHN